MSKELSLLPAVGLALGGLTVSAQAGSITYDLDLSPRRIAIANVQIVDNDRVSDDVRAYCTDADGFFDCHRETLHFNDTDSPFGFVPAPAMTGRLTIENGTDLACDLTFLQLCADDFDMGRVFDAAAYTVELEDAAFNVAYFVSGDDFELLRHDRAALWSSTYLDTTNTAAPVHGLPDGWEAFGVDLRGYVDVSQDYDLSASAATLVATPLPASLPILLAGLGALVLLGRRGRAV